MLQAVVSKVVSRFVRDERGATMLEYGLLVGLIAIVAIGAIGALGGSLSTFFTDTTTELDKV
jgi:pilus assembly protein Flp/PilA